MNSDPINIMEEAGVKPTSNRILVLRNLLEASTPLSLIEIEDRLETLDRSSILRVLTLFHSHDIVHSVEDGRGVTKYEICHATDHEHHNDMHPHFYCKCCERVFCFDNQPTPCVDVPEGFVVQGVNYMLKGICPDCRKKGLTV